MRNSNDKWRDHLKPRSEHLKYYPESDFNLQCVDGFFIAFISESGQDFLDRRMFYTALVIITVAKGAKQVALKAFLDDQVLAMDQPSTEEEVERAYDRSDFWWNFVSSLASFVAVFVLSLVGSFLMLTTISAAAMGVAFLLFYLGTKFYMCVKPTGSSLGDVPFVIRAAITKRNAEYPHTSDKLFRNTTNLVQVLPHVSWLRWLDKAAVMQQEQSNEDNLCSVEEVMGVKFLLKMLPMWTTFLTFSVVIASGSTFFLEEATAIEPDDGFPIMIFIVLQAFTEFIVSKISFSVLRNPKSKNIQVVMLVRIGIGMICSVLCCVVAWINAARWLHLVKRYDEPKSHTSVYRLTPQFLLLGVMGGLSEEGLQNFFNSQVSNSLIRYGPPFRECVMGVGKFISVICIIIFRKWFKDDINSSRLDKYYELLAIISCIFTACWYGDKRFFNEEDDIESGGYEVGDDFLGRIVCRSLSDDNRLYYNYSRSVDAFKRKTRSFPHQFLPDMTKKSFGDDLTRNTYSGQESQADEESVAMLSMKTEQETEKLNNTDTNSTDQVSIGQSTPSASRSFSRLSSTGIYKRVNSMR